MARCSVCVVGLESSRCLNAGTAEDQRLARSFEYALWRERQTRQLVVSMWHREEELRELVKAWRSRCGEANEKLEKAESDILLLEVDLSSVERELESKTTELADANVKLDEARKKIQMLEAEVAAAQAELKSNEAERELAKREAERSQEVAQNLNRAIRGFASNEYDHLDAICGEANKARDATSRLANYARNQM